MRSKVVYILGAGFTAPLGLPVMANFLERSKDLFADEPLRFGHFSSVFDEIKHMAQAKNYLKVDLFNIEHILSILDMEDYAAGTAHRETFRRYLADVVSALTPKATNHPQMPGNWEDWLFAEDDRVRAYCYWLAGLLGVSVRRHRKHGGMEMAGLPDPDADFGIISLNYDMVLERCLALINSQCDASPPLEFRGTIEGAGMPLAKIHGSVEPLTIVPPTWQKLAGEEVREAWRLAVHLLKEANEVRVLGFSFPETDGYVRYLISLGAMRAPHLKRLDVVCLDPEGDVAERYQRFVAFPGFRFRNGEILGYLSSYGQRTDERVAEEVAGERVIRFRGINGHHLRNIGVA